MSLVTLLLFCTASIALAVTPGPTMLLAFTNGIGGGMRAAAAGIAGATLASATLIMAVAVGLAAVFAASEVLFDVLRVFGVLYLVWLGIRLWRTTPASSAAEATGRAAPTTRQQAFTRSATVAASNPKALLFFSAFLPQFVDATQPIAQQYAILGTVFVLIDAIVMLAYAYAGVHAGRLLAAPRLRLLNRTAAGAMFVLAALLAVSRRPA
jgi:threonine/homoserine/homoserine lactone efflux protein